MGARNYLLEIGTEELPSSVQNLWRCPHGKKIPHERASIETLSFVDEILKKYKLDYSWGSDSKSLLGNFHTPRRLTVFIENLDDKQKSENKTVKGPAIAAAYDAEGNPTQALNGFARGKGIGINDIIKSDDGYVYAKTSTIGKPTVEILPEIAKEIISTFSSMTQKTMRWGSENIRFARPIRWIVSIYGDEVVPFEIDGVKAGNLTYGHRFLSNGPFKIDKINDLEVDYIKKLKSANVIVEFKTRRNVIKTSINKICQNNNILPSEYEFEALLTEVANLVEHPNAGLGSFDKKYLELPRQVLETSMRSHQRYFPVESKSGELAPSFVVIHNGNESATQNIIRGNERVLTARLDDAHFFFTEDIKNSLASYIPRLKGLVFHSKIGTMAQKTSRVEVLTKRICEQLGLDKETVKRAIKAASLCKADLSTHMVIEFPSLQGVMGKEYALAAGEDTEVAEVVYEHYLPKGRYGSTARLPESVLGQIVAVADKVDSSASLLAFERPTASRDPYGIRRQITGAVRIIVEKKLSIDIAPLIFSTLDWLKKNKIDPPFGEFKVAATAFLEELGDYKEQLWKEDLQRGIDRPETRPWAAKAVLGALVGGLSEISFELNILELNQMIDSIDFLDIPILNNIFTAYSRCKNLLPKGFYGNKVNESLFENGDKNLFDAYKVVEASFLKLFGQKKYEESLMVLANLRDAVDTYFDEVLVMVKEENVKNNRLSLLKRVSELYEKYAIFSEFTG